MVRNYALMSDRATECPYSLMTSGCPTKRPRLAAKKAPTSGLGGLGG
jgi:hypothetical protein